MSRTDKVGASNGYDIGGWHMASTAPTRPAPVASDAFVRTMRRVASSVAVVTTDGSAGCHGATVSAFSSVSADPPMILVCLLSGSRIANAVAANGNLCINVLPQDRPDLANRFAGRDDHLVEDRFSGVDYYGARGAAPQIDGATIFSGLVDKIIPAGSHSIVICHVQTVRDGCAAPLAYLDGNYHCVVPHVVSPDALGHCAGKSPQ
jgi:flavin reductase (DIM6/NTAB) family NADH-FMN oxidoreductase RutF